ncbi:plastocyanin/azurin family copper-binding protein [Natronolimnohabitans sp. A-GB9]|uniref:plastocyanin/azurin family copper-binding protein n=1 Tax=Natronolimnohabitans sp. A-GB9 TaxID=3069757 RepID=UPI0027B63AF6|nr:plastocyanin/azurin family copper-binding protein [Natronolimnohabitans sp. A-GB9]MDQ2050199.1 plastocyanin/azurin family copper-binding protein [Natronolimnohabitans sp. A-GB9]
MNDDRLTRRTILRVGTTVASAGVLAGCLEEAGTDSELDDSSDDESNGTDADEATEGDADADADDVADESDNGRNEYEAAPGEEIVFYGDQAYWEGKEPRDIEGKANPTLVLEEGKAYTIGWDEGDGVAHNIELRDEDDAVVDDYATDITDDPGDDQFIEFEATEELATYVCAPHAAIMRGEIRIE